MNSEKRIPPGRWDASCFHVCVNSTDHFSTRNLQSPKNRQRNQWMSRRKCCSFLAIECEESKFYNPHHAEWFHTHIKTAMQNDLIGRYIHRGKTLLFVQVWKGESVSSWVTSQSICLRRKHEFSIQIPVICHRLRQGLEKFTRDYGNSETWLEIIEEDANKSHPWRYELWLEAHEALSAIWENYNRPTTTKQ